MPHGFKILSEEPLNQIGDNYVLNRGQMLTEVKCSKVCNMIRSLGQKHCQAINMKGTVMSCFPLFLQLFNCILEPIDQFHWGLL